MSSGLDLPSFRVLQFAQTQILAYKGFLFRLSFFSLLMGFLVFFVVFFITLFLALVCSALLIVLSGLFSFVSHSG